MALVTSVTKDNKNSNIFPPIIEKAKESIAEANVLMEIDGEDPTSIARTAEAAKRTIGQIEGSDSEGDCRPLKKLKSDPEAKSVKSSEITTWNSTGASEKKLSKHERWTSLKCNALMQFLPQHKSTPNPFTLVEIKVIIGEEESAIFQVPMLALRQLSDHFKTVFASPMQENQSKSMLWKGPSANPYIHVQAAAHIIEFAQLQSGFFEKGSTRSLSQLKQKHPEEFGIILDDIIRLCNLFDIPELNAHCIGFIKEEELATLSDESFLEYIQWAMRASPDARNTIIPILTSFSDNSDALIGICRTITALVEANYSNCTEEEKMASFKFLQDCFSHALPSLPPMPSIGDKGLHDICDCFRKVYPHFEMPRSVIQKMTLFTEIPDLEKDAMAHIVMKFCRCTDTPHLMLIGMQPVEKDLEEIVLLIQAQYAPEGLLLDKFNEFIAKYPMNVFALNRRVNILCQNDSLKEEDWKSVYRDLGISLSISSDNDDTWAIRGDCYYLQHNYTVSLNDYNMAISLNPLNFRASIGRGDCNTQFRNYEAAIRDYTAALTASPKDVHAWGARGYCFYKLRSYGAAFKDFDQALSLDPEYVFALANRAECYRQNGHLEAAFKDFDMALSIDPEYVFALANRGDCHRQNGNLEAAFKDLDIALSLNPKDVFALGSRGDCYRQNGNLDAALKDLDMALLLNPKFIFALGRRGDCHRQNGNFEAALKDLDMALLIDPKDVFALANRADCYRQNGNLDAALKDLDMALSLAPKYIFALGRRGDCHRQNGNLEAALKDFDTALSFNPNNVFVLARRGDCYRMQGHFEAALKDLNTVLSIDPTDAFANKIFTLTFANNAAIILENAS